jgi:hypothetical protein
VGVWGGPGPDRREPDCHRMRNYPVSALCNAVGGSLGTPCLVCVYNETYPNEHPYIHNKGQRPGLKEVRRTPDVGPPGTHFGPRKDSNNSEGRLLFTSRAPTGNSVFLMNGTRGRVTFVYCSFAPEAFGRRRNRMK